MSLTSWVGRAAGWCVLWMCMPQSYGLAAEGQERGYGLSCGACKCTCILQMNMEYAHRCNQAVAGKRSTLIDEASVQFHCSVHTC